MDRYSVIIVVFFNFTAVKQDLKTAGVGENSIKGVRLPQLATSGDTEFIGEFLLCFFLAIQNGADKIPYMIAVII